MQRNLGICLWETSGFACELRNFAQISENGKFGGMAFVLNRVLWKCNFYSMCISTEMFYLIVMRQMLTLWCSDQCVLWLLCDAVSHMKHECLSRCATELR